MYDIGMYAGGQVPFTGADYVTRPLGGSESSCILLAEELRKRGHRVCVFTQGDEETYGLGLQVFENDVEYLRLPETWGTNLQREYDVFLVERDYSRLTNGLLRTRSLGLLNHDILSDPVSLLEHSYGLDFCYCLSQFQKNQYEQQCPALRGKVSVLGNPIDTVPLLETRGMPKYDCPTFLYTSRPERGLLLLLKYIWPEILTLYPDAELYVGYYPVRKEQLPESMQAIHTACESLMQTTPRVTYMGGLRKRDLYPVIAQSHAIVYPSIFPETFNINAIESQIIGTPYLTTNAFAMRETVLESSQRLFDFEALSRLYYGSMTKAPVQCRVLTEHVKGLVKRCVEDADCLFETVMRPTGDTLAARYNKAHIAQQFDEEMTARFAERSQRYGKRIIQRLLYNSDFIAAQHALTHDYANHTDPGTLGYIDQMLGTHHHHPNDYFEGASHDEDMNQGLYPRMARALEHIRTWIGDKDFTFTDLGSGEGIMVAHVLRTFPKQASVQCVDFSDKLLEMTAKQIEGFFPPLMDLSDMLLERDIFSSHAAIEQADVVFCGEVLEHQIDVVHAMEVIDRYCVPGGLMILTMPYGPWEILSNKMDTVVYHVHHFEQRDLEELFADCDTCCTIELVPSQRSHKDNALLGNWVVTIRKPVETPLRYYTPDYERKFTTTRPYVKLGMTAICQNEEENATGFLKPFLGKVDEMVLVDTGSTDTTCALLRQCIHTYPAYRLMHHAWTDDFSEARNAGLQALEERDVDWILWADYDERPNMGVESLRKYLQGDLSLFNGYILVQRHLMSDLPEQTRDIPVRLFRAKQGICFYGVVHEHPQPLLNTQIEPKIILPRFEFLHYGYITEAVRRHKAVERNFRLLEKDRQVCPQRELGAVLLQRDLLHLVRWQIEGGDELSDKSLEHLRQVIALGKPFEDPRHLLYPLADLFTQEALQRLGEALVVCESGYVPVQSALTLIANVGGIQREYTPTLRWFESPQALYAAIQEKNTLLHTQLTQPFRVFAWE